MNANVLAMTERAAPRVLLADDEGEMRTFLAEVLRDEGYEVVEATNGRELFWLMEASQRGQPIDVVVSDLCMPEYNGLDVVEAWTEVGPRPRVLLMSAFPDPEVRRRAESLGLVLLDKPFAVGRLLGLVRALSSRRGEELQ